MRISVLIPAYNSAKVIAATLDSVLKQNRPPDEILVLDDGSTDDTMSVLNRYRPAITVLTQKNGGVANARNHLSGRATGDLVAFLDHDDIWHPDYLAVQGQRFQDNPQAAAFFTKHLDFHGFGNYEWSDHPPPDKAGMEIISPLDFIERYNNSKGLFYSMSFCCIPKRVLEAIGKEPFSEQVSGVDDCYLGNQLPLLGPVVYTPIPLVAYRMTSQAQSVNQLKNFKLVVEVFQLLEERYRAFGDTDLLNAFKLAFAGKRRRYGKTLMGAGRVSEARSQFRRSITQASNPFSMAKSLALLCLTCTPPPLQPKWPASQRYSQ